MATTYILTLSQSDEIKKKVYVSLSEDSSEELRRLSEKTYQLYQVTQTKKNLWSCDLDTLKAEVERVQEEGNDPRLSVSCHELQFPVVRTRPQKTFLQIWKELTFKWPIYIPIVNLFWALFVTPFLSFLQILKEPNRVKTEGYQAFLEKQNRQNYHSFLEALQDFHSRSCYLDASDHWISFREHLSHAIERGKRLQETISQNQIEMVQKLAEEIQAAFDQADVLEQTPRSIASIPFGFEKDGHFVPLFITFSKVNENTLRLELNSWGDHEFSYLQKCYEFNLQEDSPKVIHRIIRQFFLVLPQKEGGKDIETSLFQHMQQTSLEVVDYSSHSEKFPEEIFSDVERWLHANLYLMGAVPFSSLKKSEEKVSIQFFPEIPFEAKLECTLAFLYEQCTHLEGVLDQLSSKERVNAYFALESKVQEMEEQLACSLVFEEDIQDYTETKKMEFIQGKILEFKQSNPQVQSCVDFIEKLKGKFQKAFEIDEGKIDETLASRISVRSFQTKIPNSILEELQLSKKMEKSSNVSIAIAYPELLQSLENFRSERNLAEFVQAHTHIEEARSVADRLIEQGEYNEARCLTYEVMRLMPNPMGYAPLQGNSDLIDLFSETLAGLSQHIWECSLRMRKKALEPAYLVQLIKMQCSILSLIRLKSEDSEEDRSVGIDREEILNFFYNHPHYRFGMYPKDEEEIVELVHFLRSEKNSCRLDVSIRNPYAETAMTTKVPEKFAAVKRKPNQKQALSDQLIDLKRSQLFLSCLAKPSGCLCKFYDPGILGRIKGLNWLDSMHSQAVREGYQGEEDIKRRVQEIQLIQVEEELNKMNRLEIEAKMFVTDYPTLTIVDSKRSTSSAIAYMPSGYGLPFNLEQKYGQLANEQNTEVFTGNTRSIGSFIGGSSFSFNLPSPQSVYDSPGSGGRGNGYNEPTINVMALSEQKVISEKDQLSINFQKKPKEGISQISSFGLDSLEYVARGIRGRDRPSIHSESIFNALIMIQNDPNLLYTSSAKRKIELVIYRPFALKKALESQPFFFIEFFKRVQKELRERWNDDQFKIFYIQLADAIRAHIHYREDFYSLRYPELHGQLGELLRVIPSLDSMREIGDFESSLFDEFLKDLENPEKNQAMIANCLLRHLSQKQEFARECEDFKTLAKIIFAGSIFLQTANEVMQPQFNQEVNRWITEQFQPYLQRTLQEDQRRVDVLTYATRLITGDHTIVTLSWEYQEKEGVYVSNDYRLNIKNLSLTYKNGAKTLEIKVVLPAEIKTDLSFMTLFGKELTHATVKQGKEVGTSVYSFTYKEEKYQIIYNQLRSSIQIFKKFSKDFSDERYFLWVSPKDLSDLAEEERSSLDTLISEKGLWIDEKEQRHAYVMQYHPREKLLGECFYLKLDKKGKVQQAIDPASGLTVISSEQDFSQLIPCQIPSGVFLLGSQNIFGSAVISEIVFLNDGTRIKKSSKEIWEIHHRQMGNQYRWLQGKGRENGVTLLMGALGVKGSQVVLPMTGEKEERLLMYPYPIRRSAVSGESMQVMQSHSLQKNGPSLSVSLDLHGNMKASPSSYLYLAYFFAMKRDYVRAHVFLERAEKSPRISAEEFFSLEQISDLFSQFPAHSLKDSAFALRGTLTILNIRTRHFGQSLYDPRLSSVYYQGVQKIADMHERFEENLEKASATGELILHREREALTEREGLEIQRLCRTSLRDFSKAYLESHKEDLSKRKEILEEEDAYSDIEIDKSTLSSPPRELIHRLVVLAKDIEKPTKFSEISNRFYPDIDTMLTRFFPFYRYIYNLRIDSDEQRKELEYIVSYLSLPTSWSHIEGKDPQKKRDGRYAEMCRQYLLAACYKKAKEELVEGLDFELLKLLRKELPLLRAYPPFSLIVMISEQLFGSNTIVLKRGMEAITKLLQNLVENIPGPRLFHEIYGGKAVFKEKGGEEKGSFSIEKIRANQMTSLEVIKHFLDEKLKSFDEDLSNPFLKLEMQIIVQMIKEETSDKSKLHKTLSLIKDSEARNYSVLDMRKLAEDMKEIQRLEPEVESISPADFVYPEFDQSFVQPIFKKLKEGIKPFYELRNEELEERQAQKETLKSHLESAKRYFPEEDLLPEAEQEENRQISRGLDSSFEEISEEILQKKRFTQDEITSLKRFVDDQMTHEAGLFQTCAQKQRELLEEIEKDSSERHYLMPADLRAIYQARECYSTQQILDVFLNLFSTSQGREYLGKRPKLFEKGLEYMLLKSVQNQFEIAQDLLKDDMPPLDHVIKAKDLLRSAVETRLNFTYEEPHLAFRCLVTECKSSIILRKKQMEVLEKINKDPMRWDSLRMGIGKTSYLMPIIADLLAHKGYLPVLTVPSRLFNSNRDQFDRTTREIFSRGAFEFRMPIVEDVSVAYLSEKYLELLKVKQRGSYVITDTQQLALLNEEIIQIKESFLHRQTVASILFARLRLHYLQKIASLLYGQGKIKSRFYGDEVDDTHHISKQINRARGEKIPLDRIVIQANQAFFEIIMKSEEGSDLFPLKEALLKATQMTWKPEDLKEAMRSVAKRLLKEEKFLALLEEGREEVANLDEEEWASYLLKEREELPRGLSKYEEKHYQKVIGAMKTVIGENALSFFSLQTGNSFGFSQYLGPQIVPKTLRIETEGMRYGDIFDLVHAQFLGYIQFASCQSMNGSTKEFFIAAIERLRNKNPTEYQKLDERARAFYLGNSSPQEQPLYEYLLQEESWDLRLQILDSVFSEGYIDRYKEQIEMNVQDLFHGASYGGVTGTLDPYVLPHISDEVLFSENTFSTRAVESETLLRICMNLPNGLDTEVEVFDKENISQYMTSLIEREETSAIINNSGVGTEGIDNLMWVALLRENTQRSFLFTHPNTGTAYLWKKGEESPIAYLQQALPKDTICVFAPFDTRGTDRPISRGDVHLFLGPATTLQELMQAIYRARKLGDEHRLRIHIDESLASQVASRQERKTYGDVINYIKKKTLEQNLSLNLRAQTRNILGEIKAMFMQFLREPYQKFDDPTFWNKENFEQASALFFIENKVFEKIQTVFIKEREINFESMYLPAQVDFSLNALGKTFDEAINEVKAYQAQAHNSSQLLEILDRQRSEVGKALNRSLSRRLQYLLDRLTKMKENFLRNEKKHAKFLPTQTVLNASMESGTHEQVLELQSTQTQEVESEQSPEKARLISAEGTNYIPLDIRTIDKVWNSRNLFKRFSFIGFPFPNLLISPDADVIYKQISAVQGDALFYVVVSKDQERLGLITRTDMHSEMSIIKENYAVFAMGKEDSWQIISPSGRALILNDRLRLNLAKARLYLGFTEFLEKDIELLKNWVITDGLNSDLKKWAQRKGTQRVLDFVNKVLLEGRS